MNNSNDNNRMSRFADWLKIKLPAGISLKIVVTIPAQQAYARMVDFPRAW